MAKQPAATFPRALVVAAVRESFKKLDPRVQWRNPVMFVVLIGAVLTTLSLFRDLTLFTVQVTLWLWFTLLFANFAEAMAEGRGQAHADALRKMRTKTTARRLRDGVEEKVSATELRRGDLVVCEAGDVIPADGDVIEGIASVDEAAITGESAPVVRESGGDRSAVTGGTRVLSDRIIVSVTSEQGQSFLDRMIAMVEGAARQKTPNEVALGILLVSLTGLFILAVATLPAFARYSEKAASQPGAVNTSIAALVSLLVCLIPTTIGGLLNAIGISGIDRLMRRNVLATSGRAVEAAGDIDVLLLDKTGTITLGNRQASAFVPAPGVGERVVAEAAQLASLADETPEGRSVVVLAKERFNLRAHDVATMRAHFVPFTAQTRMSGVDIPADEAQPARSLRKGAAAEICEWVKSNGGTLPHEIAVHVEAISHAGGTPLVVAESNCVLGIIHLKDIVKGGIRERFAQFRKMGIRTVMITGDNPKTAAAIAAEAGVDDFMAQATPEDKMVDLYFQQSLFEDSPAADDDPPAPLPPGP